MNNIKSKKLLDIEKSYELLLSNEGVKKALQFLKDDNDYTTQEQIDITSISAPTFMEEERGRDYYKRLVSLGIENVKTDEVGNVFGIRRGKGEGPTLVVCAHLDTVFPDGTKTEAKWENGKVFAPGIADDGRGLAVVLTLIRALNHAGIQTDGDILFGATVGEEGLGDLRGVKALFSESNKIDGFISIEPGDPERTTYLATGSKRYRVTYNGPGGHSFGNFGTPSAIHAVGRAIAKISELETPINPKTTFNVGLISGGTSVNTIAEKAGLVVDIRSTSQIELDKLEETLLSILRRAAEEENKRWGSSSLTVESEIVGDRPAGVQDSNSVIVRASLEASKTLGFEPILAEASSTDSNVPIHLGIPAVTLGGGGDFGGAHTLQEYYDPTDAFYGAQKILLTVLGLVGISDSIKPLLEKR